MHFCWVKWFLLASTTSFLIVVSYEQNDYTLKTERAEVVSCDEKYGSLKVKFFKYNRTYTALNFTIELKRNFGNDARINVEGFKFQSNEYRQFPIIFERDFCADLQENNFGVRNVFGCGNFSGCPLKKGFYHICNWGADYSKFPPHIPAGQYRMDVKLTHFSENVFFIRWYIKIDSVRLF